MELPSRHLTTTEDRIYRGPNAQSHSKQKKKNTIILIIIIIIIMKTLCFTLGLLLLTACCCNAMPRGLRFSTSPIGCCFNFNLLNLPSELISTITMTHKSCAMKAFIVKTVKGRKICYSQDSKWAQDVYRKLHDTEGSAL